MKAAVVFLIAFVSTYNVWAQGNGFPFGKVTYRELDMLRYEYDTSATAVVLQEFGEAYIEDDNEYNLLFEHHVKLKILTQEAVEKGTIEIPLRKSPTRKEELRSVKASSFSLEGGVMKETKLEFKNVFTENMNKYWDIAKFAIPNVKAGSVIEYQYTIESPFIFNFRPWYFQDDLPKIASEFWATIPGNYIYNTTLRGFFKLAKEESELLRHCFYNGRADCARYKYAMAHVPALKEEEYMTAKSNFLAAINFELSEVRHFDGRVEKYTKTWESVDDELLLDEKFGLQIKRGKSIVDEHIDLAMLGQPDSLERAKNIYAFIKDWYQWDEVYGIYSEFGIRKAFENKKGNVADINLSLIAALRYAGFYVEPLILSTRQNGLPIDLHPVLSDFNYVIAKLNLGGKYYLLDAVDDFMPFGTIPIRCLNGKGRVLGEERSYWLELKAPAKMKRFTVFNLKLEKDGLIHGTMELTHYGYEAINKRKEVAELGTEEEYFKKYKDNAHGYQITKAEMLNVQELSKELVEKYEIEIETGADGGYFLFGPFLDQRIDENPFKSPTRFYPVDYGAPIDHSLLVTLEYPDNLQLAEVPEKAVLGLPNSGGRYLFGVQQVGTKVSINSVLNINKTVYSSDEYHFLKELYNRMIQIQNTDLVFKAK